MNYKPTDVFVGAVEFFSILLPGAMLTFLILFLFQGLVVQIYPNFFNELQKNTLGDWAVVVFAAYFLGHMVDMFGFLVVWPYELFRRKSSLSRVSGVDKYALRIGNDLIRVGDSGAEAAIPQKKTETSPIKDMQARLSGRREELVVEKKPEGDPIEDAQTVISAGTETVIPPKNPETSQFEAVKIIVRERYVRSDTVLPLATAIVGVSNPMAMIEIDRLTADAKFFKSATLVLFLVALAFMLFHRILSGPAVAQAMTLLKEPEALGLLSLVLAIFSFARFVDLRDRQISLVYELFITSHKNGQGQNK